MTSTTLRSQVGQLITFGFDGTGVDDRLRRLIGGIQPSGIILFARNIETPRQTWEVLREAQKLVPAPLFRCVDMEGGTVDRLKKIVAPAPSAAQIAASGERALFRRHGRAIGEECRALGFNVDFAPVVDLAFAASQSVMGSRVVSAEVKPAVAYAREFLRGLKEAGVLGCLKHFPGLGAGSLDSHFALPSIEKPWKKLWEEDLGPYRALKSAAAFVMVAHANYPAVEKGKPATLSARWIRAILREKIGFRGLVVSDDLEMGGALAAASIEEAAVETVRAGADIFLVCHKEEFVERTYEAVLRAAEKERRFAARVAEAARQVLAAKRRWRVSAKLAAAPSEKKIAALAAATTKLHARTAPVAAAAAGPGTPWD